MEQNTIIKSQNDNNIYYTNTLSNGLKYIIITDPDSKTGAVSLNLDIGSSYEPNEINGLAHCLEHILFLGTEKYPKHYFDDFIYKNSGSSNAYTTVYNTNYQYDISNEVFEKSLDIFVQFFICPLFESDLIEKELNSINSEFKSFVRDDNERIEHLKVMEGYKNCNYNKFVCGCLKSLKRNDIREKVIKFYKSYYTPDKMSLCVQSNIQIEEINKIIVDKFSLIKKDESYINDINVNQNYLYDENNMGYIYQVISIKNKKVLKLYWVINENYNKYYKSKPFEYITNILGHEGKYSLTSYLKKKVYIFDLTASYCVIGNFYTEFEIDIKLTEEGYNKIMEIISIILSYIKLLQNIEINENFFREIQKMSKITFDYYEKDDPIDNVTNLAESLRLYPINKVIFSDFIIEDFEPELIKKTLNSLTLKNLNIYIMSRDKKELNYNKEKWMEIEYYKEKFNYFPLIDISNFDLGYPMKNLFIPENFELIDFKQYNINPNDFKYPKKIIDSYHTIYYKPDIEFKIPKVYISCICTISNLNLKYDTYNNYCELFIDLLEEVLNEDSYFGELSDNNIKFSFDFNKFTIEIIGFSDTIESYTNMIFTKLQILKDISKIENIKNKLIFKLKNLIRILENKNYRAVDSQSNYRFSKFLLNPYENYENQLKQYEDFYKNLKENDIIDPEFILFIDNLFSKTKFEWLVQGNILPKDSERIIYFVENQLLNFNNPNMAKTELTNKDIRKSRIANLSNEKYLKYNFESEDLENENNCLFSYFQIGDIYNIKGIKNYSLLKLIDHILNENFYYELRTKQQLGYNVETSIKKDFTVCGMTFYVQSNKNKPDFIQERINKFFCDYDLNDNENFSDEDFESYKNSLLIILEEKDYNLLNEFNRNISQITTGNYIFEILDKMINCIRNEITKEDVINFYNDFFYKKAKRIDIGCIAKKEIKEEDKDNMDNDESNSENEVSNESSDSINKNLPSYENAKIVNIISEDDFNIYVNYYDKEFY